MNVRPIIEAEKAAIRKAKQVANAIIKAQRLALAEEMKYLPRKNLKGLELKQQRNAKKDITGQPVFILCGNDSMLINYELLQKLAKSLHKRRYWTEVRIKQVAGEPVLSITHPRGMAELNQLPKYQEALLIQGLPVVRITD